ncbi:hypothetical protein MSG28_009356 [Choristoneura fumiferana]|uniref:Uncharacterized protein n=1 Tax=Choristoneura fumiferana TaxID=7141 RepID=A0ACC0KY39_CHOFU|nr:hypothetical protein MSG28_009356 [Choristoneura fumiferana]
MALFKFEGDLESLSEPQLKLVESVLQKHGFKEGKVTVEPVGKKGDNYAANVKRFIHESDGDTFKMIGKSAPAAEILRKLMKTAVLFNNEIIMYQEVIPKLNNLQDVAGIPDSERIRFPVCYGVLNEEPNELILLEDLSESNFEMLNRFVPLSNEIVRLVLKDLAIFHSLSYALKEFQPETYKNFVGKIINMWALLEEDVETQMFFEATENNLKALMDSEKYKKIITGSLSQTKTHVKKIYNYEKNSKYSVIQQGDCWSNNIMFKLEKGKVIENVMIDYQLSKESNPAADLLYFIFNCTDHGTRVKHYHEWIDYYHEMLDFSLANHGLKSNRILPRDQLDADLRRYSRATFGFGLLHSSMVVRESKDALDFKALEGTKEEMTDIAMAQIKAQNLDGSTVMALKHRIMGLVDSCLELGLL